MPDHRHRRPTEERRFVPARELRAITEGETRTISGYAALFNSASQDLGGFQEVIAPGAFADALTRSDVRCLFNHDPNYVLGRTRSQTLTVAEDEKGLRIDCTPPDTQYARDLMVSIDRGDVDQMSFGFITREDVWEFMADGKTRRTIIAIEELFDVSVVTYPAYADTSVALRSMETWQGAATTAPLCAEMRRRRLALESVA
jgi:HK97 family phage prohead protease